MEHLSIMRSRQARSQEARPRRSGRGRAGLEFGGGCWLLLLEDVVPDDLDLAYGCATGEDVAI